MYIIKRESALLVTETLTLHLISTAHRSRARLGLFWSRRAVCALGYAWGARGAAGLCDLVGRVRIGGPVAGIHFALAFSITSR